jgi:hypothetical protein
VGEGWDGDWDGDGFFLGLGLVDLGGKVGFSEECLIAEKWLFGHGHRN